MYILSNFKESAEKFPERNAFCINNNFYSYSDFAKYITGIKDILKPAISNEFSSAVGVCPFDDIETYASLYAIMFSGLTFVPINSANPTERNSSMISLAGISTILTSRDNDNIKRMKSAFPDVKFINTGDLLKSGQLLPEINLTLPEDKPDNAAYIMFTSGSTGIPKAVPISNKNLDAFLDAFFDLGYQIDENDRFLQSSDLDFDLSIMTYMFPLAKGSCVYTLPEEGIKYVNIYSILQEHEITLASMVPSVLSYLRPFFSEIRLEKMRYSMFCGEAMYTEILHEWSKCLPNALVQNVYGPTEATVFCLAYNWNSDVSKNKEYTGIVSIGKPMKNMEAIVIDESYNILPPNEKGELCLAGMQLTSGYLKNPEKNNEVFFTKKINGEDKVFYKTGDIAFRDEQGDFMYCGRKDYQIKIHGYRIELGEIEYHARQVLENHDVVALTTPNHIGIPQIHLFVEGFSGEVNLIFDKLKTRIPDYMMPVKITTIPDFPLNANGKIDRKALSGKILE